MMEHVIEMLKISKYGHVRLSCGDTVVCFRARWSVDVLGLDADQGLICRWCAAVRRLIASWDIMIVTLYTDNTQNTWCCFLCFGLTNTLDLQVSATVRWVLVSDCDASVVVFVLPSCSSWHPSFFLFFFVRSRATIFPCRSVSRWYCSVQTGESQQLLSSHHSLLSFLLPLY